MKMVFFGMFKLFIESNSVHNSKVCYAEVSTRETAMTLNASDLQILANLKVYTLNLVNELTLKFILQNT